MNDKRVAVIIGAGPAGLTAALELLRTTDVTPIVLEATDDVGGISRTVNHNGWRMDIGGHRFFSKSDWVMNWWREILPVAMPEGEAAVEITYQNKRRSVDAGAAPSDEERVMLVRGRLSRIYFLRKLFDYPVKLDLNTIRNLGPWRILGIGLGYAQARLFPRRPERTLEDFLVNRFGNALYRTFFKDYTEKVWGVPCHEISAEWGAQRIKGLSIGKALLHAARKLVSKGEVKAAQTSLIERFLYPKYGPGQLWQEVARRVRDGGGEIRLGHAIVGLTREGARITGLRVRDAAGAEYDLAGEQVISTMPVKDLIGAMTPPPPPAVREVAGALPYRDFITVGLLVRRMTGPRGERLLPDNWIYVQESDVKLGRLQIFNNWSPGLVAEPDKVWLGLEYFCQEGDALWSLPDAEMRAMAIEELARIGLIDAADVLDAKVLRMPKAYPAYFGSYERFDEVRAFLDGIDNLFPIGRNGMHRYNNQDHSMLTAKLCVEAIAAGSTDKSAIWAVNIDDDYHEEVSAEPAPEKARVVEAVE